MAIHPSLLTSSKPSAVAPANAHITHVQLRDLILCPREPGIVTYIHDKGIVEQDIHAPPGTPPRVIAAPDFRPNTLAALPIPDTNDILYATGGQDADLHFSYHTIYSSSATPSSPPRRKRFRPASTSKLIWQFSRHLDNCSINNSVVLTNSLGLSLSNESAVEPRVIVSNNDLSIKFFDVPLRTTGSKHTRHLKEVGALKLNVPVNHTSLSPDARTILSVGDSSDVFLHHISGGAKLTFTPITTLQLPKPEGLPFWLPSHALAASFSTAFSADGAKFAVASQEGVVAVWDVRSTKPMKVFQTDKTSGLGPGSSGSGGLWASGAAAAGWSNSAASGWLFEDAHFHGAGPGTVRAPGWSVRNVKFGGGVGGTGKEVMVFTEHANFLHIVDAKTFETEEIVRVPAVRTQAITPTPLAVPSTAARPPSGRTVSDSNLTSGSRSRASGSPGVDYVYSQLPGFARRGTRFAGPLAFSTQRDRELRDIQERRVQRAREIVARRFGRDAEDGASTSSSSTRSRTGYSPPSSIGDSTWRTLRTAGDDRGPGRSGSGLSQFGRVLVPGSRGEGDREDEREEDEAALLLIPALVEGIEARDVEELLTGHGIFGNDRGANRGDEEDRERERERGSGDEEEDRNTGSAVADFEYPYEFGDSSVWRSGDREGRAEETDAGGGGGGRGFNWMTGREEDDVDEHREDMETTAGELDLAGVCFDPSGSRLYVVSTKSVSEWHVRGADKRWWSGDAWA